MTNSFKTKRKEKKKTVPTSGRTDLSVIIYNLLVNFYTFTIILYNWLQFDSVLVKKET